MPGAVAVSSLGGYQKIGAYVPVPLALLRADTVTNFDLYLQTDPAQPPVLYREKNLQFTEGVRKRLQESRVEVLYIDSGQEESYRHYVEQNLSLILVDENIPMQEKSEALYASAHGIVTDILQDPTKAAGLQRKIGRASCRERV